MWVVNSLRWFDDSSSSRTLLLNFRRRQRHLARIVRSGVQGCLVVRRLSLCQPQRRLPCRNSRLLCRRYRVALLEGILLLAESDRNEDSTDRGTLVWDRAVAEYEFAYRNIFCMVCVCACMRVTKLHDSACSNIILSHHIEPNYRNRRRNQLKLSQNWSG